MEEWVQEGKGPIESPAAPERSVMCGSWENLQLCTWFLPVSWLHQMFLECWLKALVPRLQEFLIYKEGGGALRGSIQLEDRENSYRAV